jgi:hypothetical protein
MSKSISDLFPPAEIPGLCHSFYFVSCRLYLDKVIEERAILNRKWQGNIRYQYEANAL